MRILKQFSTLLIICCALSCGKFFTDCPVYETTLVLKAVDNNNIDITDGGDTGGAIVFIFDENRKYIGSTNVLANDVKNYKPFKVSGSSNTLYIAAWSNVNKNKEIQQGTPMSEAFISLVKNADPGDLFCGIASVKADCNCVDTVVMKRKTGLVSISIKGLPYDNYTVTLEGTDKDEYSYGGTLVGKEFLYGPKAMEQSGFFINTVFRVFELSPNKSFTINIYDSNNGLVSSFDHSISSGDLVPVMGATLNILLEVSSSQVIVNVTDWADFYQWITI